MNNYKTELNILAEKLYQSFVPNSKIELIKDLCDTLGTKNLYDNVRENMIESIISIIIEPIVAEYHNRNDNGLTKGSTILEKSQYFFKYLFEKENLRLVMGKYPVAEEKISKEIVLREEFFIKIFQSFSKDKEQIAEIFHIKCEKIEKILMSVGDQHSGESVSIIEFEEAKLMFKPRNLDSDIFVYDVVKRVASLRDEKIELVFPKYINKEDYSWQEYVSDNLFLDLDDAREFYYKTGIYMAVFLILGTTDLHYENIIVNQTNPMFIDLETIGVGSKGDYFSTYGFNLPQSGVLGSMLLPRIDKTGVFDVNISGLFSKKEKSEKMESFQFFIEEGKEWVFEKVLYESNPISKNITKEGIEIDPSQVSESLKSGFSDTLRDILKHKEIIKRFLEKELSRNIEVRQLLRPTRVYAKFLEAASTKKYLESFEEMEKLFNILLLNFDASDFGYIRVEKEIEELKKGNIPSFYLLSNSKDLLCNGEIICENYYFKTYLNDVIERIDKLNDKDIDYQLRMIDTSLASYYTADKLYEVEHNDIPKLNPTEYEDTLNRYVDYINSFMVEVDETKLEYYTLQVQRDRFVLDESGFGLYDTGGLILFLALYGKTHKNEALITAEKLYKTAFEKRNLIVKENNIPEHFSVFSGISGLLYLSYNLYKITGNNDYYNDYINFYEEFSGNFNIEDLEFKLDFLTGLSGIVVLLVNIMLDNIGLRDEALINKLSKLLFDKRKTMKFDDNSMAHGRNGYCMALASLYKFFGDELYLEQIQIELKEIESSLEITSVNGNIHTWCRGLLGWYLLVATCLKCNEQFFSHFKQILYTITPEQLEEMLTINNDSMCHGVAGNYFSIRSIFPYLNKECQLYFTSLIKQSLLNNPFEKKWIQGSMHIPDSFMLGATGLIYMIYDLVLKVEVPSVLELEVLKGDLF